MGVTGSMGFIAGDSSSRSQGISLPCQAGTLSQGTASICGRKSAGVGDSRVDSGVNSMGSGFSGEGVDRHSDSVSPLSTGLTSAFLRLVRLLDSEVQGQHHGPGSSRQGVQQRVFQRASLFLDSMGNGGSRTAGSVVSGSGFSGKGMTSGIDSGIVSAGRSAGNAGSMTAESVELSMPLFSS
jgi:hypothetical protein